MASRMVLCTSALLEGGASSAAGSDKGRGGRPACFRVPSAAPRIAAIGGHAGCRRVAARPTTWRVPASEAEQAQAAAEPGKAAAADMGAEFDAFDPLNDWQMLRIVTQDIPDEEVNELVWECLGYEKSVDMDPETLTVEIKWSCDNVFPKWAARYPQPPDLIGVTRKYYPEIDQPIKEANSSLARSIPLEHKQGLLEALKPLGWKGFKMEGLTPNKTRRAQVANWLVYYRTELRGVSLEELKKRREERAAQEAVANTQHPTGTTKQGVV